MKTLTFISAWVCSMLLSANASAQSITYNFVVADEGTIQLPIWGAEVTSGGVALNLLAAGSETFDNRFAVGPTNRNNESGNCFKFRTSGDWRGLWSQYADRNISILNLKQGDKVTFVISKEAETLKQVGGSAVVSGKAITVTEDGNLDFVSTGSVYIESVTHTFFRNSESKKHILAGMRRAVPSAVAEAPPSCLLFLFTIRRSVAAKPDK